MLNLAATNSKTLIYKLVGGLGEDFIAQILGYVLYMSVCYIGIFTVNVKVPFQ